MHLPIYFAGHGHGHGHDHIESTVSTVAYIHTYIHIYLHVAWCSEVLAPRMRISRIRKRNSNKISKRSAGV